LFINPVTFIILVDFITLTVRVKIIIYKAYNYALFLIFLLRLTSSVKMFLSADHALLLIILNPYLHPRRGSRFHNHKKEVRYYYYTILILFTSVEDWKVQIPK